MPITRISTQPRAVNIRVVFGGSATEVVAVCWVREVAEARW